MKGKKFLTKVLAAAVAVTSILPGGLTVQAAPKVQTETISKWMYTNEDKKFTMSAENWLDAETNEEFSTFGKTLYVGEGMQTWRLESSDTDGNVNNASYANSDAPACVYAKKVDISSQPGSRRVMRFVLYPPTGSVQNNGIRLGIMLKYVDETHWAFLGFNGHWYMQWMNGLENKGYAEHKKDGSDGGNDYLDTDGNSHKGWTPAFDDVLPENETYLRITVIYEDKTHIRIRVAPCEGTVDEDGNDILTEKVNESGVSLAKEDTLDFKVFGDLRDYADGEEGDAPKPIHLGFVAGTDRNQLSSDRNKALTTMDIVNVMKGALYPKDTEGKTDADYKEALELIPYGECGWTSPKGTNPEKILAPSQTGDGVTYASVGKKAAEGENNDSFQASIYNKTVMDFEEGTVSGTLRPYTVGANKEFSIGIVTSQSPESPTNGNGHSSFKIGIKNDKWVYSLDGKETEINKSDLPAIASKTDYDISMTIDGNSKLTAEVSCTEKGDDETEEVKTATLIGTNEAVDVTGLSGAVTLSTKGEILRVKDIVCKKVTSDITPLEKKYEELKDKNADYTYYTDLWNAFKTEKLDPVQTALAATDEVLTIDSDKYAEFNGTKAQELQNAFDAFNINANKVATGKDDLQTVYNAIKDDDLTADEYTKYYTAESIQVFGEAREAVKNFLASLDAENFKGTTKTEMDAKKASISKEVLVTKPYDKAEAEAEIDAAVKEALENEDGSAKYDEENGDKYYDGWTEFANALKALNDLKEEDSVTLKQVEDAIIALNTAASNVREKKATDKEKEDLVSAISDIESAVAAKKYIQDTKWNTYTTALQAAKDAAQKSDLTVKALDEALAGLTAAQAELNEDKNTTHIIDNKPKKGDVKTVGNASYTIVDPAAATVTLKTGDKKAKKVTVDKVDIDGKSYTVIGIEKNAFAKSKSLKSVTIGKNVTAIQASAFKKCTKLTKVIFKGTAVKTIAKNSFKGSKVKTVKVPKKLKKDKKFLQKVKKAGMKVSKLS